jgi:hypothetical protein
MLLVVVLFILFCTFFRLRLDHRDVGAVVSSAVLLHPRFKRLPGDAVDRDLNDRGGGASIDGLILARNQRRARSIGVLFLLTGLETW